MAQTAGAAFYFLRRRRGRGGCPSKQHDRSRSRSMPQWQYCAIHLNELPLGEEIDTLNDAGEEGWELVGITTNNVAYLKRQVAGPSGPSARSPRRKNPTKVG
jgi:hypothetical protein